MAAQDVTSSVTWSSSAPTVATVSNAAGTTGLAASLSQGSTTITATSGAISGSGTLTISRPRLSCRSPSRHRALDHARFDTAVCGYWNYTNGRTQNLTASVTWASNLATVATISNAAGSQGLATSVGQGSTTYQRDLRRDQRDRDVDRDGAGADFGHADACRPVHRVRRDAATYGHRALRRWQQPDRDRAGGVESSNDAIATVSNAAGTRGLATSVAQGSATITATFETFSGSSVLTVGPPNLQTIVIDPVTAAVFAGDNRQFIATASYADGSSQDVTALAAWAASDVGVATISAAGLATGVDAGTATITATLGGVTSTATLEVLARRVAKFAYVVNESASTVTVFTVDALNGALTPLPNLTVATGQAPGSIAIDLTGRFAYVTNQTGNTVSAYTIDAGSGALSPIPGSPYTAGSGPRYMALHPSGRFLYVSNSTAPDIVGFEVDAVRARCRRWLDRRLRRGTFRLG